MYSNFSKNIEKIFSEFTKLNKHTKAAIKFGTQLFLALFALGTLLLLINRLYFYHGSYTQFIANEIISKSFTIFAEVIVGCLLVDYVFNK